jgi:ATP/maltotriose-dependent transcriptional regulator MalT
MTAASVDFPHPDSPTMPKTSPSWIESDTPSTALTSGLWPPTSQLQAELEAQLERDAFDTAWRRGQRQNIAAVAARWLKEASRLPLYQQANQALSDPLTERELEVLTCIAVGMSNREIAEHLVIAPGTVKRHISNTYGKLEVSTRTQAILRAQQLNLI